MTQDEQAPKETQGNGDQPLRARSGRSHAFVGILCAFLAVGMLGMAYAAVPLYQMFCSVTGYGGTTRVATTLPGKVLDRNITIRFDSNVSGGLPWTFKPVVRTMTLRIGESQVATYTAFNNSDVKQVGTAAFNVTPESAGLYFNKIECFCFTEQILEPGESAELPVTFFIDPEIMEDKNTRHLSEITLSYTFFPSDAVGGSTDGKQASSVARDKIQTGG